MTRIVTRIVTRIREAVLPSLESTIDFADLLAGIPCMVYILYYIKLCYIILYYITLYYIHYIAVLRGERGRNGAGPRRSGRPRAGPHGRGPRAGPGRGSGDSDSRPSRLGKATRIGGPDGRLG